MNDALSVAHAAVQEWTPVVPRVTEPEVRLAAAALFISRDAYKYLGVIALVIAGLMFLGPCGLVLGVLPAAYGIAIVVSEVCRGVREIRQLARPARVARVADPSPHEKAVEFVRRWNESNRESLLRVMQNGGIRKLNSFDCPLETMRVPSRGPRGKYRFVFTRRYVRAGREYAVAYNHLVWQGKQLQSLRDWASSSSRPCVPQLEKWLEVHTDRDAKLAEFVLSLLSIARESDPRIIEQIARDAEDKRRREQERLAKLAEEERKERERREEWARRPRPVVYYTPAPRDTEADRAADRRWQAAMATLEHRVAALDGAERDLARRGEHIQLAHVQQEHDRLEEELRRWKQIARNL